MPYSTKILADSLAPNGARLTTFEVSFPRIVLAEFNTHRVFSRNSASSRAIPVSKMIERVEQDPFLPVYWGKNQKGMQASVELTEEEQKEAEFVWLGLRDKAVEAVRYLSNPEGLDVHKQIANRLLEPFLFHTVIVSATEWANFFALRCHKDAQPEIRKAAVAMQGLYKVSEPRNLQVGEWHLPLTPDLQDLSGIFLEREIARISCARCARVSYLTHDGKRDPSADLELAERLQKSGHMSPFEHAAIALAKSEEKGNFIGWLQYRKMLKDEAVFRG